MIDITNCNKIIIDTNEKVEKIIDWYEQNKDWLDAEEFRIPIPSALVELPEEDIKFYYESEGVFARLHLYMAGVYVCNYRYDPKSQKIGELIFPAALSKEKRKAAQMILAADRTEILVGSTLKNASSALSVFTPKRVKRSRPIKP